MNGPSSEIGDDLENIKEEKVANPCMRNSSTNAKTSLFKQAQELALQIQYWIIYLCSIVDVYWAGARMPLSVLFLS